MKKTILVKSPVPLLISAAVWLIWALALPMYSLIHFVIVALVSLAAGLIARRFFKPKEFVVFEEVPIDTGDRDVDELISKGRDMLKTLRGLRDRINHPGISAKIDRMDYLSGKIFDRVTADKSKARQVRRFMNYYLPTAISLLENYVLLSQQGVDGSHIKSSMDKIETVMEPIVAAFEKQLDNLFADKAMDISADIQVLNDLIRAQGLAGANAKENGKVAGK